MRMPIVVAVLVAILAGLVWSSSLGAVAGGVLAWLVLRSVEQRRQIASLQESLKALQALASQGGPTPAVRAQATSAAATARA